MSVCQSTMKASGGLGRPDEPCHRVNTVGDKVLFDVPVTFRPTTWRHACAWRSGGSMSQNAAFHGFGGVRLHIALDRLG